VLRAWEAARDAHPAARAVALLAEAFPDRDDLARLPVARRDALLARLRAATVGTRLDALADCPSCGETLGFSLDLDLGDGPEADAAGDVRLPTTEDLLAVAGEADLASARLALARRCAPGLDPDAVAAAIETTRTSVALDCPACGHAWLADVDVAEVFWAEVTAEARRLLHEVAALARAYGWREADVLAMSAARRRAYLELA
jgi:predicted RNA-binding Zn-ribbon protein involved in translation (DUF1610 family)